MAESLAALPSPVPTENSRIISPYARVATDYPTATYVALPNQITHTAINCRPHVGDVIESLKALDNVRPQDCSHD